MTRGESEIGDGGERNARKKTNLSWPFPTLRFKKQFSTYLADGVGSEDIEEVFTNAYAAIRENPEFTPKEKDVAKWKSESQKYRTPKLTKEQRDARIEEKIAAYRAGQASEDEDEE